MVCSDIPHTDNFNIGSIAAANSDCCSNRTPRAKALYATRKSLSRPVFRKSRRTARCDGAH